jgi:hypothetical protein
LIPARRSGKSISTSSQFWSAISGKFVKASTAQRHPKTTVTQMTGGKAKGNRSAITGRFVTDATAKRHPGNTIREGG